MDAVLIILGILGFGAIVIAGYVFTVAARNYVSDEDDSDRGGPEQPRREKHVVRNGRDRRHATATQFPITVNSMLIPKDRRVLPERRATV